MTEATSHLVVVWIARLAGGVYLLAVWQWLTTRDGRQISSPAFRWYWGLAWVLLMLHVAAAFHWVHGWEHAAAAEHTAAMTGRVTGWYWSGGLYINYLFLVIWGVDVGRVSLNRKHTSGLLMQVISALMWFNATVVFGTLWWLVPVAVWVFVCRKQLRVSAFAARGVDQVDK